MGASELSETFDCFGSGCGVWLTGDGARESSTAALARVRSQLLEWHERFSRFLPASELSRFNADPRELVPASPLLARLAAAVRTSGALSGGLVDGTLLQPLEAAGYGRDLGEPIALERLLGLAPARRPAAPAAAPRWRQIEVDFGALSVRRPPGVMLDSGGLAKGMLADVLAETLAGFECFAINCAGDLAIGGSAGTPRPIQVESPLDRSTLHTFELSGGGVATSGIGRRSWIAPDGRPAHHLLDPSTGRPAFTGIIQVTALAPSALLAETRAKAALLSGPSAAEAWLPDGGVVVYDDGSHHVLPPPPRVTFRRLGGRLRCTGASAGAAQFAAAA